MNSGKTVHAWFIACISWHIGDSDSSDLLQDLQKNAKHAVIGFKHAERSFSQFGLHWFLSLDCGD